jgi:GTP-binding protein
MPDDEEMAKFLQRREDYKKKVLLVANKVDNHKQQNESAIFNKLGLGEPLLISAASGSGTGDLLDEIIERLPEGKGNKKVKKILDENGDEIVVKEDRPVRVCFIGQPNSGKSSLLNSILGYERVIVSDIPHTTREPQNTELIYNDKAIDLIDTAGISRHGHKAEKLEKYGIEKSLAVLRRADIVLMMLDLSRDINHQDMRIVEEIVEKGKSFIILANKWDLIVDKDTKKWTSKIYGKLPFVAWAPLQFISAKTGSKVQKIFDLILEMSEARKLELSDSQLEKFLKRIVKIHKPAKGKGIGHPRIYKIRQMRSNPPAFEVIIGSQDDLHFSYAKFIENQLRIQFKIVGTPIYVRIVKNKRRHGTSEERAVEEREEKFEKKEGKKEDKKRDKRGKREK